MPRLMSPRFGHGSGRAALVSTTIVNALGALSIGSLGGAVFYLLGAPLPWTLGSLTAAGMVAVSGGRWLMPNPVRDVARPVVGLLAGSAFTAEVISSIGEWWSAIVFVALYCFIALFLGWLFFRKLCRLDPIRRSLLQRRAALAN